MHGKRDQSHTSTFEIPCSIFDIHNAKQDKAGFPLPDQVEDKLRGNDKRGGNEVHGRNDTRGRNKKAPGPLSGHDALLMFNT